MADSKANMILTVAALMIPLSIRYLESAHLFWSAAVLIFFCLITIIIAAYAAMPKVPLKADNGDIPDVNSPKFNILFFGSFISMDYELYMRSMEDIMNDHSRSYEAQVREIYNLGQFLATKKYRFVKLAYLNFIAGLVLSLMVCALGYLL
jgi:hypothetical protein